MTFLLNPYINRTLITPQTLFDLGETGLWLNPDNPSSVFTDDGGTTLAAPTDSVERINDQFGTGRDFALLDSTIQLTVAPTLQTASNGRNVLRFAGLSGEGLQEIGSTATTFFSVNTGVTVFIAMNLISTPSAVLQFWGLSNFSNRSYRLNAATTNAVSFSIQQGSTAPTPAWPIIPTNTPVVITCQVVPSVIVQAEVGSFIRVNGIEYPFTITRGSSVAGGGHTIGQGVGVTPPNFDLYQMAVYNANLISKAQIVGVENWMLAQIS